jgi:hypothetical protein
MKKQNSTYTWTPILILLALALSTTTATSPLKENLKMPNLLGLEINL